ncbi:MAG: ribose 5-phosphate isomerase B [Alphaproteobacteria bacterium]|nr:ribose 5-phosphate isomerase B [Alphaproteobacteria bacterium]
MASAAPENTIALAADHAGVALKARLKRELEKRGHAVLDLGPMDESSVDYPDYGHKLARAIEQGQASRGVAICGTGIGITIAANRHPKIRAGVAWNIETARLVREHNDANVLGLGARQVDPEMAVAMLNVFLDTPFAGGRHAGRVAKLGRTE